MSITVNHDELSKALTPAIANNLPVLIVGAPGVGKSDAVTQAAEKANAELIISHPVVSDPTDFKGLPWPGKDGEHATFLPFGDFAKALAAKEKTVWFLDDLGQAPVAVQAATMQLLLARRVNGHCLPDCVTFVAATNRKQDKAGVSGLLEPVKSRFAAILHLEPRLDDWVKWALKSQVPVELIAFLRFRPDLFLDFKPTAEIVNSPSPRSWSKVGDWLKVGLPQEVQFPVIAGAVGEGAATELMAYLPLMKELPSFDQIMLAPEKTPLSDKPAVNFAIATMLAKKLNENNADRVLKYLERWQNNGLEEFAVLTIRDAIQVDPTLAVNPAFVSLWSGKIGQLISGSKSQ